MKHQLSRISCLGFVLLMSASCRTSDNTYLLESDEAFLEPDAQNMGVDLDADSDAVGACAESGTTEEYQLRPVDGESSPVLQVTACIDQKFNLRALSVNLNRDGSLSSAKLDSIKVSIPPEYVVGIFDSISYEDSEGQKVEIVSDLETDYIVPGYPPIHFYDVTIGDASPILMYQANTDDLCPREWFASEEAMQKFQTLSGNLVMQAYTCQSSAADGTLVNLPLWLRFDTLPESLENDVKHSYQFLELQPHSTRRNFRHEVVIDDLVHFIDEATNGDSSQGDMELYPSRIRDYRLESRTDPCSIAADDSEICLEEAGEIKWSYSLVRICVGATPTSPCSPGAMEGEFYCHEGKWRCRYQQTSSDTHKALAPAERGDICELGEENLFIPHCKSDLRCQQEEDEIARCR